MLKKLLLNRDLTTSEAEETFGLLLNGELRAGVARALLLLLARKGEAISEITGAVKAIRKHEKGRRIQLKYLVDTCGTGGDRIHTFNISTIAAFLAAGAGARVAKHGNRSVSSACGSSDLLESLGVNIKAPYKLMLRCLKKTGFAFFHAPFYHPSFQQVQALRRELKLRTIFNLLGPLLNPLNVKNQLIGVYDSRLTNIFAQVLRRLGSQHVLIVHGRDGLDEVSVSEVTLVTELKDGKIRNFVFNPREYGIRLANLNSLRTATLTENKEVAIGILKNKIQGAKKDAVIINAAFALYASQRAASLIQAISLAKHALENEFALKVLKEVIKITNTNNKG